MNCVLKLCAVLLGLVAVPTLADDPSVVTVAPNVSLRLQGIAVAQELRSDYYIGVIYLPDWSADLAQAASETVPKRMRMKLLAERLSAREFQRHWKERIALNNPRPVWQPQGERILKFANAFRDNLQRGDQIDFDFLPGQGTSIRLNGQLLTTITGDGFYPLLLSAWLGDIPPTRAFQTALRGAQDSETRARLILNLDGIAMVSRPLTSAPQVASVAAPAPIEAAPVKPTSKPAAPKSSSTSKPAVVAASKPTGGVASQSAPPAVASTTAPPKQPESSTQVAVVTTPPASVEPQAEAVPSDKHVAAALEPEIDEDLLLGEYKREALQKIRKQLEYPARAWRLGLTGSGVIRARIAKDGGLLGNEVVVSTGQMILDTAMVSMLERSLPLPALPVGITSEEVALEIPVDFVR